MASVQEAEVTVARDVIAELWRPESLERLARAYWAWLSRVTLSLVRVVDEPDSRAVVLFTRRLPLLRFGPPEYDTGPDHGSVTWPILRGVLVARTGRDRGGFLRIAVNRREPEADADSETLTVRLEVRNFYPWQRTSKPSSSSRRAS